MSADDRVRKAIRELLRAGVRPSVRTIRAHLLASTGVGHSFREIMPIVREWREAASKDPKVAEVAKRYRALDVERRATAREWIQRIDEKETSKR